MKKCLLILLLFVSCSQDNDNDNAPAQNTNAMMGEFHGHTTCQPSGSYNQTIYVIAGSKMVFHASMLTNDTLNYSLSGSSITIPSQSFVNNGAVGGTYSVIGSGVYSEPQITLQVSISFSNSSAVYNCTYNVSR